MSFTNKFLFSFIHRVKKKTTLFFSEEGRFLFMEITNFAFERVSRSLREDRPLVMKKKKINVHRPVQEESKRDRRNDAEAGKWYL